MSKKPTIETQPDPQAARILFEEVLVARLREALVPNALHATVTRQAEAAYPPELAEVLTPRGAELAQEIATERVAHDAMIRRCLCGKFGCHEPIARIRARPAYAAGLDVEVKRGMRTVEDRELLLAAFDTRPPRKAAA